MELVEGWKESSENDIDDSKEAKKEGDEDKQEPSSGQQNVQSSSSRHDQDSESADARSGPHNEETSKHKHKHERCEFSSSIKHRSGIPNWMDSRVSISTLAAPNPDGFDDDSEMEEGEDSLDGMMLFKQNPQEQAKFEFRLQYERRMNHQELLTKDTQVISAFFSSAQISLFILWFFSFGFFFFFFPFFLSLFLPLPLPYVL